MKGAHHVSTAASGTLRAGLSFYDLPGHGVSVSSPILFDKEIDRKTFLEMWDLSRPGGDAEECFLRVNQTELYDKRIPRPNPIETMPNVSSPRIRLLPIG